MVEPKARFAGSKILARQVVPVPPGGIVDFEIEISKCLPAAGEKVLSVALQRLP